MPKAAAHAMNPLKLIALDEEDLAVLSSLLQDAVVRVADMTYLPGQKRFAAVLNRFDWEKAVSEGGKNYRRRRTAPAARLACALAGSLVRFDSGT
jgi:hypothetical protein